MQTKVYPFKKTPLPSLGILQNHSAFSLTISTGLVTIGLLFKRVLPSCSKAN
uniref:Uncharacterized protein n=1 Tax=uncultured Desulfobacterales bacterium HF0200_07G10 TaxID=710741 RepID=E0XU49_9BACT|nr:hypothetical protein [uncultured Desulfobacterales bacterium HF0200_07G10]